MGRDPKIVKIDRTEGEVFFLSYVRADDGKRWAYKCKVDGARVIWASAEGRWRTHPDDGAVFYSTTNSSVVIEEGFADGSKSVKAFTTQQLGN